VTGQIGHAYCEPCGKRGFFSRKSARAWLRLKHRSDKGMRPYQCPEGMWHVGHMPDIVRRRGIVSAAAVHEDRARRRSS
jgi:hypothetical protein